MEERGSHIHPSLRHALKNSESTILIAIHIRRGDILESVVIDKEHRLVSYNIYLQIMREIIRHHLDHTSSKGCKDTNNRCPHRLQFLLFCEGAPNKDNIADYMELNVRKVSYVNISQEMSPFCNASSNCAVEVLHNASFYEAFTTMCESDILVTSTSGYAWSASVLCDVPMTVGFPWGSKYHGIQNVIHVLNNHSLWRHSTALLLEDGLPHTYQRMLHRKTARERRRKDNKSPYFLSL